MASFAPSTRSSDETHSSAPAATAAAAPSTLHATPKSGTPSVPRDRVPKPSLQSRRAPRANTPAPAARKPQLSDPYLALQEQWKTTKTARVPFSTKGCYGNPESNPIQDFLEDLQKEQAGSLVFSRTKTRYNKPTRSTEPEDAAEQFAERDANKANASRKREKAYAPIDPRLATLNPEDAIINTQNIYAARQVRRAAQAAHVTPNADLTSIQKETSERTIRKEHDRSFFKQRTASRMPGISPNLDFTHVPSMSIKDRIYFYNKTHKCKHHLRFNIFSPVFHPQTGELSHLAPSCSHQYETLGDKLDLACANCLRHTVHEIILRCKCTGVRCQHCKFAVYTYEHEHYTYSSECCACGDPAEPFSNIPNIIVTKPPGAAWTDVKGFFAELRGVKKAVPRLDTTEWPALQATPESGRPEEIPFPPKPAPGTLGTPIKLYAGPPIPILPLPRDEIGGWPFRDSGCSKNGKESVLFGYLQFIAEHHQYPDTPLPQRAPECICLKPLRHCVCDYKSLSFVNYLRLALTIDTSAATRFLHKPPTPAELQEVWDKEMEDANPQVDSISSTPEGGAVSTTKSIVESAASATMSWFKSLWTSLRDMFKNLKAKFYAIAGISSLFDAFNKTLNIIHLVGEYILELIRSDPFSASAICLHIYELFNSKGHSTLRQALLLTALLRKLDIFKHVWAATMEVKILGPIFKLIMAIMHPDDYLDAEPQGGFSNFAATAFGKFCSGISSVLNIRVPDFKYLAGIAADFNKLFQANKNILCLLTALFGFLPLFMQRWFKATDLDEHIRRGLKDPQSLVHKAAVATAALDKLRRDEASEEDIVTAKVLATQQLMNLQEELLSLKLPPTAGSERFINSLRTMIQAKVQTNCRSAEPFCIYLAGASGIGKSTLINSILSVFYEGDAIDKVYYRMTGTDHWDGYLPDKHEVLVYDDFNQSRDEKDIHELINAVSVSNMVLPMASISAADADSIGVKGTVLRVKLVICFSNVDKITPVKIYSEDAINRRRHCAAVCSWRDEENHNRELDYSHAKFEPSTHSFLTVNWKGDTLDAYLEAIHATYQLYLDHNEQRKTASPSIKFKGKPIFGKVVPPPTKPTYRVDEPEDKPTSGCMVSGPRPEFATEALIELDRRRKREAAVLSNIALLEKMMPDEVKQAKEPGTDTEDADPQSGPTVSLVLQGAMTLCSSTLTAICQGGFVYTTFRGFMYGVFGDQIRPHPKVAKVLEWTAEFAAIAVALSTGYALMRMLRASPNSGQTVTAKRAPTNIVVQSSVPDTVFKNNVFYAELRSPTHILSHITVIFVEGTTFLTVDHFFHGMDDHYAKNADIWIYDHLAHDSVIVVPFDVKRLHAIPDHDLALYSVPSKYMPCKRSVISHFTDGSRSLTNVPVAVYIPHETGVDTHFTSVKIDGIRTEYTLTPGGKETPILVRQAIQYHYHSKLGDCGSPLVTQTSSNNTIVGIHFGSATSTQLALARPVNRSLIQKGLDALTKKLGDTITVARSESANYIPIYGAKLRQHLGIKGCITLAGYTDRPVSSPTKTDIRASPLSGLFQEPTTAPAILDIRDPRMTTPCDFMIEGINKYNKRAKPFPNDIEEMAMTSIAEDILKQETICLRRTLTFDEAINGLDYPYIDRLNMHSSAGFPFCLDPETKGAKKKLFKLENDRYVPDSDLLVSLVKSRLAALDTNQRIDGIPWIDIAKDERRPIAKVATGRTRTIVSAPLDYVLVSRMFNLPFVAHFYQCRLKTFSAVGINCGSLEWDRLVRHMIEVGDSGFDGDYSCFDGTLSASLGMRIPEIITKFFGDKNKQKRTILIHEIFFCLHQCRNFLYHTQGGNSSGGDMTVVINTIVSEAYLRCVWQMVMPPEWKDLYHYRRFVRTAIYGDDNWVIVERFFAPYFNAEVLAKVFAQHNIVYTTAAKVSTSAALKPFTECSFLKRTTRSHNGTFLPLFEETANFETINWIRECDDPEAATEDNCNAVLRNAFFYGSEYFNHIRDTILKHRPSYNLIQFASLYNDFYQRGFVSDPTNDFGFTKAYGVGPQRDNHHYLLYDTEDGSHTIMATAQSGPLSKIANSLLPDNIVGDVLSVFGLDKPAVATNPEPIIERHIQYFSPTRNIENMDKLVMDPSSQDLCDREHFANTASETNIKSLTSRPSYVGTVKWQVTDPAEKVLWTTDVGPMTTVDRSAPNKQEIALLDYISNFATYWRGGIIYTFQIISSAFHEGRLDITSHPTVKTPPSTYAAGMSQYNTSFVLRNSGNVFKVLIPFESDVPWKKVYRGQKLSDVRSEELKYTDFFIGSLALRISVPLKAPDVVVPNVDINVFIQGASDFELAHPTIWGASLVPALNPGEKRKKAIKARPESGEPITLSDNMTIETAPEEHPDDARNTVSETAPTAAASGDLDTPASTATNSEGTNLAEQTPVSTIKASLGKAHHSAPRAEGHCGEPGWELDNMLSRYNLVATQVWKLTDAVGAKIADLDVVKDTLTADIVATPFLRFVYFRSKMIKFRIQLTASRFHQGNVIACFVPSQRAKAQANYPMTYTRAVQIQHGFLDPSTGTVIELAIPFCYYKGYLDLTNDECLGQLQLYVFNQLQAAQGGATSVDFKIFMSVVESDFKIPRPGGESFAVLAARVTPAKLRQLTAIVDDEDAWEVISKLKPKTLKATPQSGAPSRIGTDVTVQLNSLSIHGESNSMVLCPVRAAVTEPTVKHFSDKFHDLRELAKRWTPLIRFSSTIEATTDTPKIFGIVNLEGLFGNAFAPARIASMFRNMRGSLNFRVIARSANGSHIATNAGSYFAIFVPHAPEVTQDFFPDILEQFCNTTAIVGKNYLPRAYFDERGCCDLQIPYLSQNDTLILQAVGDNEQGYDEIFPSGNIIIGGVNPTDFVTFEVYFSISDEFHYGTFMGCPPVLIARPFKHTLYPDQW